MWKQRFGKIDVSSQRFLKLSVFLYARTLKRLLRIT
jgi:hypothetical protein